MQDMTGTNSTYSPSRAKPPPPYFSYPYSLPSLSDEYKHGLVTLGVIGMLSVVCCSAMLLFVAYRLITWRLHYKRFISYNQYIVLIINLLLADMMQGIAFSFSFYWVSQDGIFAPTEKCFGQGFLVNLGDVASSFFVFGIALHTFYGTVKGRHASHKTFYILVVSAWILAMLLTSLGPILYRQNYYVRAGYWCWASSDYQMERLLFHYFWIFLVQFATVLIYSLIFLYLRRAMLRILPLTESTTQARVDRAAKLMVVFPVAYITMTLPLSAGRMWSAAHESRELPDIYMLVASILIGSCGIVDCLLYTLTRRSLLKSGIDTGFKKFKPSPPPPPPPSSCKGSLGLATIKSGRSGGILQTRTVTIVTSDSHSGTVVTPDFIGSAAACSSGCLSLPIPTAATVKIQYPWSSMLEFDQLINPDRPNTPASLSILDKRILDSRVEIRAVRNPDHQDDENESHDDHDDDYHHDDSVDLEGGEQQQQHQRTVSRGQARYDIPHNMGHVLRLFWKTSSSSLSRSPSPEVE